jgi:hypothetical protein
MTKFIGYFIALPASLIFNSTPGIVSHTLSEPIATQALIAQTSSPRYQPLSTATCNQLRQEMNKVLKVRVTMKRSTFQDFINGGGGTSCQLTVTGNGRNFKDVDHVLRKMSAMLTKQGWGNAPNYVADGPTGVARGFRKGNNLALLNIEWEPSANANCPNDQPISDCELSPEQQLYRITLDAVRR